MSRIDELIEELCPDGVKHIQLHEITHFANSRIDAQKVDENTYVGVENLLQNKKGKTIASSIPSSGNIIAFEKGNILIGNIRPYLRKIWLADCNGGTNGDVLTIQIEDDKEITPEFLYYLLSSEHFFTYITQNSKGAKMPRGDKNAVMKYVIPVPPLPLQSEIVRILDNFTELTAELTTELTAELTARKKQYEYYRNQLLKFGDDVPNMKFGETCCMKSGKAIVSTLISSEKTNTETFECFGGNGIRGFVSEASHHGAFPIIGRQGALCGNVNYAIGDFYATEHAVVVKSNGKYNQRFLYYLLTAMNLNQYKSQGAQPGLAVGNIENLIAPVPTLLEQERIVNILDRFDTLCNDISAGLPAEIEARKKQYEYYRDKLLTFKQLEG